MAIKSTDQGTIKVRLKDIIKAIIGDYLMLCVLLVPIIAWPSSIQLSILIFILGLLASVVFSFIAYIMIKYPMHWNIRENFDHISTPRKKKLAILSLGLNIIVYPAPFLAFAFFLIFKLSGSMYPWLMYFLLFSMIIVFIVIAYTCYDVFFKQLIHYRNNIWDKDDELRLLVSFLGNLGVIPILLFIILMISWL